MTNHQQTETVAAADAAGGQFAKAFLPGLVLGLVLGLFIGAWLPPFFGGKPDLISSPPGTPRTAEDRYRDEAGGGTERAEPAESAPAETPAQTPSTEPETPSSPAASPGR